MQFDGTLFAIMADFENISKKFEIPLDQLKKIMYNINSIFHNGGLLK